MTKPFLPPALRHRRYRLLWFGLLISVTGTQMQSAAILWHVHELTGQPIALGGVGLARIVPVLAFSLLAGVVADTLNRRHLILLTQTLLALLAALLGWLTLRGLDSVWAIYGITAASAGVAAFDLPARQSLIPNLVPRSDLTNAFSLSSIAFQTGAVVGPAAGGLVLASLGIAWVYWINAVSFLAV
ncbi:MAG: MFS transporter, partial [Anaerolineales bacterium]|nr:MFS transporter [Anaerolineales bacterium]